MCHFVHRNYSFLTKLIINGNKHKLIIIKELFEGPVGDYCIARNTIKCLFDTRSTLHLVTWRKINRFRISSYLRYTVVEGNVCWYLSCAPLTLSF